MSSEPEAKDSCERALDVLFIEDEPKDIELIINELQKNGFKINQKFVDKKDEFTRIIGDAEFDIILADHNLRDWTGVDAFNILKENNKEIPFVLVTGALGDEQAVDCIKQGISDYVLKSNLKRLPLAIKNILKEHGLKKEYEKAQKLLRDSDERFRKSFEHAGLGMALANKQGKLFQINKAMCDIFGYTEKELIELNIKDLMHPDDLEHNLQFMWRMLEGELDHINEEIKCIRKDGEVIWILLTCSILQETEVDESYFIGQVLDITDKKRNIEELRIKDHAINSFIEGIIFASIDGEIIYSNHSFARMWGYDGPDEVINKNIIEFWKDDNEARGMIEVLTESDSLTGEMVGIKLDGSVFDVQYSASKVADNKGETKSIMYSFMDISERNMVINSLIESEERFRQFFENSPVYCYMVLPDGTFKNINVKALNALGYKKEELVGKPASMIYSPNNQKKVKDLFNKWLKGEIISNEELEIMTKEGETLTVLLNASQVRSLNGDLIHSISVQQNITDRKKAEEDLKNNEQFLRESQEIAKIGSYVLNVKKGIWKSSKVLDDIFGIEDDYARTVEGWLEIVHPDDREMMDNYFAKEVLEKRGRFEKTYRIVSKNDGTEKWVHGFGDLEFDSDGEIISMKGIIQDITDRTKSKDALTESEERYHSTIDSLPDIIHVVDDKLNILIFNEEFNKASAGIIKEDPIGKPLFSLFPFLDEKVKEEYQKVLETAKPVITEETTEVMGKKVVTETRKIPIFDTNSKVIRIITIIRDITNRKIAEDKLQFRLSFEGLISSISSYFVNIETTLIDNAINVALEKIGKFAEIDRCYIFSMDDAGINLENTHEWCAKGIKSRKKVSRFIPVESFKGGISILKNEGVLNIPDIDDKAVTKKLEKDIFRQRQTQSVLCAPVIVGEKMFGFMGFDCVTGKTGWSDDTVMLLKSVAEIFSNALERKSAEEALKKSEETFRNLIETMAEGLIVFDSDGQIIHANPVALEMGGFKKKRTDKHKLDISELGFVNPDGTSIAPEDNAGLRTIKEKVPIENMLNGIKQPDGSLVWVLVNTKPVLDEQGEIDKVVLTFSDITGYRKAEEEIQNFFNLTSDTLCIMDLNSNRLKKLNPALAKSTGLSENELLKMPLLDLWHPQDHNKLVTELTMVKPSPEAQSKYFEIRLRRADGSYMWQGIKANLFSETGMVYAVGRDINDRKLREQEIRRRLMKYKMDEGNIYIIKEKILNQSIDAFNDLLNVGYDGSVFSRRSKSDLEYNIDKEFNYFWLAESDGRDSIKPDIDSIRNEIAQMPVNEVILFDRMDYLAFKNGIKNVISLVQELKEAVYLKDSIAILSLDPATFSDEDLKLLEKECLELEPLHKTMLNQEMVDILKYIYGKSTKKINPTYNALIDELKMSRPTARKRLMKLIDLGYIMETKKGREKVFELTEKSLNMLL